VSADHAHAATPDAASWAQLGRNLKGRAAPIVQPFYRPVADFLQKQLNERLIRALVSRQVNYTSNPTKFWLRKAS
jgi:hypothetical protein